MRTTLWFQKKNMTNEKRCRKCDEYLPISNFFPDRMGKFWVASTCKECQKSKQKKAKKYVYRRKATGQREVFEQIKIERSFLHYNEDGLLESCVRLRDIDPETKKDTPEPRIVPIRLLDEWNFSHIIAKWQDKSKMLDKDNIELVTKRWHYYHHNKGILHGDFPN